MTYETELMMLDKPKLNEAFYWKGYKDGLENVRANTDAWEDIWRINYENGIEDAVFEIWEE